MSIPTPSKVIPRGRGISKAKIFKGKYEAKLEFPWDGGLKLNNVPCGVYAYFLDPHNMSKVYGSAHGQDKNPDH